jgi:predicted phosphohydrolase
MRIRYVSDLHLEISRDNFRLDNKQKDDVLVLAGDICCLMDVYHAQDFMEDALSTVMKDVYINFINDCCKKFKHVIMVLGNHDYWGLQIQMQPDNPHYFLSNNPQADKSPIIYQHLAQKNANFHLLSGNSVFVDNVLFIGATLWTDMKNGDPMISIQSKTHMNDWRKIYVQSKYSCTAITPADWVKLNKIDTQKLAGQLNAAIKANVEKIVVVTHMAPFSESVGAKFVGNPMNHMFHNNNFGSVKTGAVAPFDRANIWIHGHMHDVVDYNVLNDNDTATHVVANPRGYVFKDNHGKWVSERTNFNPNLFVEI